MSTQPQYRLTPAGAARIWNGPTVADDARAAAHPFVARLAWLVTWYCFHHHYHSGMTRGMLRKRARLSLTDPYQQQRDTNTVLFAHTSAGIICALEWGWIEEIGGIAVPSV